MPSTAQEVATHAPAGAAAAAARAVRALAALAAIVVIAALVASILLALRPDADGLRARAGRLARATVVGRAPLGDSTLEDLRLVSTSGLSARCAARRPGGPLEVGSSGLAREDRTRPAAAADAAGQVVEGRAGAGASTGPARSVQGPRYPGFLIAAGYETGRWAVSFPEVGGVVLIACDYPFDQALPLTGGAFWRALPAIRRALVDSPPTLLLALDYLARRPDVDPESVAIVGASVGVPPATVAAALDVRARATALLYGGGDVALLFAHNFDFGSRFANGLARLAIGVLARPVEPTRYAGRIAPRPVLAVNAPRDAFFPLESARALQRALRQPKEVRWLELDHFGAFHERDLLARLTALAAAWFRENGIG